jgi:hypothetical protein
MKLDWKPLREELANWGHDGRVIPVWWRDDDAIEATPELARLANLSQALDLPVHLACIPRDVTQGLVQEVAQSDQLIPVVHGWAHQNHAPQDAKKAEFGATRDPVIVQQDLTSGMEQANALFGARLCPMFVPPWNRFAPEFLAFLAEAEYQAVSTFLPREQAFAAPGVTQINTHLDPIAWRSTRGLVPPEQLIVSTVKLLCDRRLGLADTNEPLGYLTHHLVHDEDIWEFTRQFLSELRNGPVSIWSL